MKAESKEAAQADETYDLTVPQKCRDLLRLQTFNKKILADSNTLTLVFEVSDVFDYETMNKAYNHLIKKFDSLRLYFFREGFKTKQRILPYEHKDVRRIDIDDWNEFDELLKEEVILEFSNTNPILTQIVCCKDRGALIIRMSHNLADGYSLGLIAEELKHAYGSLASGEDDLNVSAPSITHYIAFQEKYLKSSRYAEDKKFWVNENLHQRRYRPVAKWIKVGALRQRTYAVSGNRYQKLSELKDEYGCSMEFLMAFAVALTVYKIKGLDNFGFSMLGHGRRNSVLRRTVGNIHELYPIYWDLQTALSVRDQIKVLNKKYLEYMLHGQFPFYEQMVSTSKEAIKHRFNFGHLTWLSFSSVNSNQHERDGNYKIEMISPVYNAVHFFVEMFHQVNEGIHFDIGCSTIYSDEKIEEIFSNFGQVIDFMADSKCEPVINLR